MRTIALTVTPFLVLSLVAHAAELPETETDDAAQAIKSFCKEEWDTDYRMVKRCMDRQEEAAVAVRTLWDDYGEDAEERRIVERCVEEWRDSTGRPDWRMVENCSERQIEAYEAIQ